LFPLCSRALGFEDAVVSKEAQDDTLAAALWLRSAELVGLPA